MRGHEDAAALARRLVAASMYMTLATADARGRPWASPVWFAPWGSDFLWVSDPEARHSRNIAVRPDVAMVVFDSTVPIGGAEALYVEAAAAEVPDIEIAAAMDVFSRRSVDCGASSWTPEDVRAPARFRLYRASSVSRSVLGPGDRRIPIHR